MRTSLIRLRPGNRYPRCVFGINGSTSSHNSSDTNGLAICAPAFHLKLVATTFAARKLVPAC